MSATPRGRTKLVIVTHDANRIVVKVAAQGSRTSLLAEAYRIEEWQPSIVTAFLAQDGHLSNWLGGGPENWRPAARQRNFVTSRIAVSILAARAAGTLRLAPLLAGEIEVCGRPVLCTRTVAGGWEVTPNLPRGAPSEIALLPVSVIPRLIDTWATRQQVRVGQLETSFAKWRAHSGPSPLEPDYAITEMCRELALPQPQRVPEAFLDGTDVRAAWTLPTQWWEDEDEPDLLYYQILSLTHEGRLTLRTIYDDASLSVLPVALRHAFVDHSDSSRDFGAWCRGTEEGLGYFRFNDAQTKRLRPASRTVADLRTFCRATIEAVRTDVYNALDPALVPHFSSIADYNILNADGDKEKALARKQATTALFGSMDVLLRRSKAGLQLLRDVDSRYKLHRAAAKAFRVPLWVVRRLTTTDRDVLEHLSKHCGGESQVAMLLMHLGPKARLRSLEDAKAATEIAGAVGTWSNHNFAVYCAPNERLILGLGLTGRTMEQVGWKVALATVREAANRGTRQQEIADYLRFLVHCIEFVSKERLHPEADVNAMHTRLVRAACLLLSQYNLVDVIRWSERFHVVVTTIPLPDGQAGEDSFAAVPEVLQSLSLPTCKWEVRQLRDQSALDAEGQLMRHCVALYGERIARQVSAIFSLVAPDASTRMTVEVCRGTLDGWRVLQARAHQNAPVLDGSPAHAALEELIAVLDERAPSPPDRALTARPLRIENIRYTPQSYVSRLHRAYGDRTWTILRHTLPGSAHGSLPAKLWAAFRDANPDLPKRQARIAARRRAEQVGANEWAHHFLGIR